MRTLPTRGATPVALALLVCGALLGACEAADEGGGGSSTFIPGDTDAGGTIGDAGGPGGGATPDGPGGKPGGPDGNQPPSLYKIGPKEVALGETLVITLKANDPDGDSLSFSVFGDLPDGAKFSKASRQLVWAPTQAGIVSFLTFVVSDGELFDRETVELRSVTEKTNHPPAFEPVSDQVLSVGKPFTLQLQVSDLDGDTVALSMEGDVPPGATLDAGGLFAWTPTKEHDGGTWRVHFVASDGHTEAGLDVGLVVGGASAGSPPSFVEVPTQKVAVGETLQLEVEAKDPDGDSLTYSTKGELPKGASFKPSIRLFSWKPAAADAGKAYTVNFQATDGTYVAVMPVDILVGSAASGGCTPDKLEPNDTSAKPAPLAAGKQTLSLCDGPAPDEDWFSVDLAAGQKLTATVSFDSSLGDLDLDLYDGKDGALLTQSTGVGSLESISLTSQTPRKLLLVVYGVGQETFQMPYTLDVQLSTSGGGGCADDSYEPNDDLAGAAPIGPGTIEAHICPNDIDAWKVDLACGEALTATVSGFGGADLDLYVFDPKSPAEPVVQSVTSQAKETVATPTVASASQRIVVVSGYPADSTDSAYSLTVATKASACAKDFAEPNDVEPDASPLLAGDDLKGLTLCCDDDWFSIDVLAGQTLLVSLDVAGTANVELSSGGKIASTKVVGGVGTLSWQAPSKATATIRLRPITPGITYALKVTVSGGAAGCTTTSCPLYKVCNKAAGTCVSDFCLADKDCPSGYVCVDTYCSEPCAKTPDCRTGYDCKGTLVGWVCGIDGAGQTADPCVYLADCAGSRGCIMQSDGGYCAQVGCKSFADCPADSECADAPVGTTPVCARWCFSADDCPAATTCSPWSASDGSDLDICLP